MYKLNLNLPNYQARLKGLINQWNDHSKIKRPLVIIKISQAFTMYHQVSHDDWTVENRKFNHLHPVLINDLETGFNVLLTLDTTGRILHCYLINNDGSLSQNDQLLRFAHKTIHQEYLDYFYCINQNVQNHCKGHADSIDK